MTATLKKALGEGHAFLSDEHGSDNLYKVLAALAEGPNPLTAHQATIATAVLAGMVAYKPMKLKSFSAAVATCGTDGSTVVELNQNGTAVASITIANDDADGTVTHVDLDLDVAKGDVLEIEVATAPTGGSGLNATATFSPAAVE